jgi:polyphenol oxidase
MPEQPSGWLVPQWPAPDRVRALVTSRNGGVSQGPYRSLNLGTQVGDNPQCVMENRGLLRAHLPAEPKWLTQVHGTNVVSADRATPAVEADAAFTRMPGTVCAIMMADCLPVLIADREGSVVAAVHAGWRGLAAGVIENTVHTIGLPPAQLLAWLGPAIGPSAFEVGSEVRETFIRADGAAAGAFIAHRSGKWLADLYNLARLRLRRIGMTDIHGGGLCTNSDPDRFFSHRRDKITGRMAALIWLEP